MIPELFAKNWRQKLTAIICAVVVWVFINQSITDTKTLTGVPIRIINLPEDKTIVGLLPTGYMNHRISLTLNGSQRVIDEIEGGDVEVFLDASSFDADLNPILITKKNLLSLNPQIDVKRHITSIDHPEFALQMCSLVSATVPVQVRMPVGVPPEGYEFLDIFPPTLTQTIAGPEEEVEKIKQKGYKLIFNLSNLTKQELDQIGQDEDEICFFPPKSWKQIQIPHKKNALELVNDPKQDQIRIDFLKKKTHFLAKEVPLQIFYPQKWIDSINPRTHRLMLSNDLKETNGVIYLKNPLYVKNVSRSFLDFIQDHIQLVIIAAPKQEREHLLWSFEVIKPQETEDAYVAYKIAKMADDTLTPQPIKEDVLRKRFREYLRKLSFWTNPDSKLNIVASLEDNRIQVEVK
jgi:hypothetical protein